MIYKRIADRIINNVANNYPINMEYRDVYVYSLERYLSNIFNLIFFGIVALILRIPLETIVFVVFYGPLRKYAGGIHMKSRGLCLVLSVSILVAIIWLSQVVALLSYWRAIAYVLLIITCILVFRLAPVDSPRRRLSEQNRRIFRTRSRWIIIMEVIIIVAASLAVDKWNSYIILGTFAVFLEGIFLIPKPLAS